MAKQIHILTIEKEDKKATVWYEEINGQEGVMIVYDYLKTGQRVIVRKSFIDQLNKKFDKIMKEVNEQLANLKRRTLE